MAQAAIAVVSAPSLTETAKRVYWTHKDVTAAAVEEFLKRCDEQEQGAALREWAASELLNKARLQSNHARYTQAHELRARLAVEEPPAGYRNPTASPSVVTMPTLNSGAGIRLPIAAIRVLMAQQLRLGQGRAVKVETMHKPDVLKAAGQLEIQGRGCLENAGLLRSLAREMREGERVKDTVRRMERG